MKRIVLACIIALTLCVGCESTENTDKKSGTTSQTAEISETNTEKEVTTEEITTETVTEESTETTTEAVSTTTKETTSDVTTETNQTTTNISTADKSGTVVTDTNTTTTTTTRSVADGNTEAVRTIPEELQDVEGLIIFDDESDEGNEEINVENNTDIPENPADTTENNDEISEDDSGVIELPFIPF